MKQRILTGWTVRRGLYLIIGFIVMVQSYIDAQWAGVAMGAWFAAMGIFAFDCAGGACFGSVPRIEQRTQPEDITFEEVK